ncbi:hypothetical protein GOP47_0019743 [Adiantum capillus-veneris]|uniref:Homeobox domain-containing protein n=1 Tax=Adiantum capillus-veneris TaxID=13818 RepID=A0A9D4Z7C2_ADICA|nr:hypothetical protein GOP47_0019743 [Adiantum capillus-veneris]
MFSVEEQSYVDGLDVFGAVEELHNLSAKEMNKLLRDSQHLFTLRLRTGRGSFLRVNLERLVSRLPLHLLACLASRGTEPRLRYLLRGVRLLHSFSDLALRHPKLEQSFLQEVKIREQILDLIIYMLITLAGPEQEGRHGSSFTILHAALVACSLHLLPAFVAGEWSDLVPVLLVHPKVDIFMDAAFDAVRRDIGLLQTKLRALNSKLMSNRVSSNVAESMAEVIAQQCEASVQVLQSLCQPQAFRDKVLNHKELCRNGGVLHLVLTVLKLHVPFLLAESKYLVSLVARLKSKVLSLMVKFCETESVSFLDEVAADARTMHLAEMVAAEVFTLVRKALTEEPKESQESDDEEDEMLSGLLYIHAMRMADIFSDDSNFRNSVMDFIAPDLAKVLAQSPTTFLTRWCGSLTTEEIKPGSDSVLIYDPFRAAGAAMHSFKSSGGSSTRASGSNNALLPDDSSGCSLSAGQLQFASYSQERSSLFVKILANLHCFNPEICPANEKDRFLNLFVECLMVGPFTPGNSAFFLSTVQTAVRVCENLFLLLDHVSSLSLEVVSDEDLQLVSTFYCALHDAICPSAVFENAIQEDPVVAYVRDAHEQKRKALLGQWQRSERWKRIQSFDPSDDKEQSNAGSSINKSTSNTSLSQEAADEQDTSGFVENFDDVLVAKRSREASDAEEEVEPMSKRQHSSQQWEMDSAEMDWTGEEHEVYQKDNVLDAEVEKFMVERRFFKVNDCRGVNHADSTYLESKTGTVIVNTAVRETFNSGSCEDTNLQRVDLRRVCETEEKEASLERGTRQLSGEIVEAVSSQDVCPAKDIQPLNGDSLLNCHVPPDGDVISLGLDHEKSNRELSQTPNEIRKCYKDEDKNISLQNSPNVLNAPENNAESAAHVNPDSHKSAAQCEAATEYSEASFFSPQYERNVTEQKDLNSGVEMACGDSAAETDSTSLLISNVTQNLKVEVDNEKANTILKITLNGTDVAGDDGAAAYSKIQETGECVDSQVSTYSHEAHQDSSGNTENNQENCVQQNGIDFEFELKVVDLKVHMSAVQHQGETFDVLMNEESQKQSPKGLVSDGLNNASQVDVSQENPKNGVKPLEAFAEGSCKVPVCEVPQIPVCEVPQVPVVEGPQTGGSEAAGPGSFNIPSSGTSQIFGLGGSQIPIYKDPYMYTLNTPRMLPGLDPSRFSEAKASVTGRPLPSPVHRARSEELQPRKRKRNIMSDEQMAVIENALLTEPYLRRHPDLIMQWTIKLNKMGPEISYQQLKNWLNNRKARLARQRAGELQGRDGEMRVSVYNHDGSAPGSSTCSGSSNDRSNDPNRSTSEDGTNTRDSGSTSQAKKSLPTGYGTPLCRLATEDIDAIMDYDMGTACRSNIPPDLTAGNGIAEERHAYSKHGSDIDSVQGASHRSAPVKFVKCEAGQYVSLLDRDGREAAKGTLYQVEGFWQGKRIDEQGICIVRITDLNVEKSTRLPHPSVVTGNTFEEAEKLCGQMIVAWDTKRIFLIS